MNTSSQSNDEYLRLNKFLSRHYVQKGCNFTHTSLGKPPGSFYVPVENTNEFYNLYCESLDAGDEINLTEKNRHLGPLKIDLDLKFALPVEKEDESQKESISRPSESLLPVSQEDKQVVNEDEREHDIQGVASVQGVESNQGTQGTQGTQGVETNQSTQSNQSQEIQEIQDKPSLSIPPPTKKPPHVSKQLKAKQIEEIVRIFTEIIVDFLEIPEDQDEILTAYVTEKKGVSIVPSQYIKDGVHIIFPNIVTKASVQYVLRQNALIRLKPVFESFGCINTIDNIIDEAIIERNNWMMYGSRKHNQDPYLLTKIYEVVRDEPNAPFRLIYKKPNKHAKPSEYVRLFSIRNKYDETFVKEDKIGDIHKFEEQQEERRRKMQISEHIISDKKVNRTNEVNEVDLGQVEKLVEILDVSRVENYEGWIRLGWCLRNIDHRLLGVWEACSKRSTKYVPGECDEKWMRMNACGLGIGTLHMWAKQDNKEAYNVIVHNEMRNLLRKSLSGTHTDIAYVIKYMYRHKFVCTSIKYKHWYEFVNHRWKFCDQGTPLRLSISEEVWAEYMLLSTDFSGRAVSSQDEDEKVRYQELSKKLNIIAGKLKMVSFKENIMRECAELFYDGEFESRLDQDNNLLGFENGIYDLNIGEFRKGQPEDYVSLCVGCDYIEYDPNHKYTRSVLNYMSQVFTKPDVREYMFKLLASFLNGSVKEQKFYIWTGVGSNSKSLLVEFFMDTIGDYACIFPITLLTMKRAASNAANSELARAKGKRFAIMSEPSNNESLNVGFMKELTGGDKIITRQLFREPIEYKPQFKIALACNDKPRIPSDDGGTWRRIRVVEYSSKFVEHPTKENEFPLDPDLKTSMVKWKSYFMAILLQYYKIYAVNGLQEPEDVLECTKEYKRVNDHMSDYVYTCIEKKEGCYLSLNDAFTELKAWVRDDNISMQVPTKPELEKYLSRVIVKSITRNNVRCYPGYRLKQQSQMIDDE